MPIYGRVDYFKDYSNAFKTSSLLYLMRLKKVISISKGLFFSNTCTLPIFYALELSICAIEKAFKL